MSVTVLIKNTARICPRCFNPSVNLINHIFEVDRRGGYMHKNEQQLKDKIKHGMQILKKDVKLFGEEVKDAWRCDRMVSARHNDYEYFWKFHGAESIEPWVVTADRDNLEGFSKAELVLSKNNNALFQGYLSQKLPNDGIIKNTGYVNLRSPLKMKSFVRQIPYDWSLFTHVIIKCRGDGRHYSINIHMDTAYDIQWFDLYSYPLYTRGGPYWQIAKIPFSKFFLSSKGRVQDEQTKLELQKVRSFGLTLGDGVEGPFQLEIEYIALIADHSHEEDFAYETYMQESITLK